MSIPNTPRWSDQQLAVLDWCENGSGSAVIEAVAGAGKSTTLIEAASRIRGQVLILAYGNLAAADLKEKLAASGLDWKKAQASTVHGMGAKAIRKSFPSAQLVQKKVAFLVDDMIADKRLPLHLHSRSDMIQSLVTHARNRLVGVVTRIDNVAAWRDIAEHFELVDDDMDIADLDAVIAGAQAVLTAANADTTTFDFDDMIYWPLLHRLPMWRFDSVFVDEAQDTNAARRGMVRALVKKGGRVVAVGDRRQAIFQFTGADSDSLDLIKSDFNCIELPMTVTFRCPKAVVTFAQQWVSHITAHETAPEGEVSATTLPDFLQNVRQYVGTDTAILCRNNGPLVELAFKLISMRVPCAIKGRDLGAGLIKLARRWKVRDLDAYTKRLDHFFAEQTTKLLAKKEEDKLARLEDQVQAMHAIIEQCRVEGRYTMEAVVQYIDSLFQEDVRGITLSSIHKSKGLEWDTVFWLDRANTCPNKWARQDWQVRAENNLCYVAATRAKRALIDIACAAKQKVTH